MDESKKKTDNDLKPTFLHCIAHVCSGYYFCRDNNGQRNHPLPVRKYADGGTLPPVLEVSSFLVVSHRLDFPHSLQSIFFGGGGGWGEERGLISRTVVDNQARVVHHLRGTT